MGNFRPDIGGLDESLIGYESYAGFKGELLGLATLSGVEFVESSYALDFIRACVREAESGTFLHLHQTVQVRLDEKPDCGYESLQATINEFGLSPGVSELLYSRRIGITMLSGNVSYARIKTVLPHPKTLIPEAQRLADVSLPHQREFEEWEHELRRADTLTPFALAAVLSELAQFRRLT